MILTSNPILVLNGGSSSIKFSIFGSSKKDPALKLIADREVSHLKDLRSFSEAAVKIVQEVAEILNNKKILKLSAIGHRVVHSGPTLTSHQRITPKVLDEIRQSVSFAPLHQPIALEIIQEAMHAFPGVSNYACFDTIFHQSLPKVASTYPIPKSLRKLGLHRYGFHGLSCEAVVKHFDLRKVPKRLIVAHLGNGASITAIRDGKSIDTTMGLTPCGGIVMGTRSGDLDPGLIFYLLRTQTSESIESVRTIEELLDTRSGLLALSDLSSDMRELRRVARAGNSQAILAIESFVIGVKKAIGGYAALMGGIDALVFTGGIGEHDVLTRSEICDGMASFGITLNTKKNESEEIAARTISDRKSSTIVYVMPAEEDRMIAEHVANLSSR